MMKTTFFVVFAAVLLVVSAGKKPDCDYCSNNYQCASYHCRYNKCVPAHDYSKCFAPLCAACKYGKECKSGKCYAGKCVEKGDFHELLKCGFKKECDRCDNDYQCATKKCWSPGYAPKKCTFDNQYSKDKCFPKKPDCARCYNDYECHYGRKCRGHPAKCVDPSWSYIPLLKCGFKDRCQYCSKNGECATGLCLHNKCRHNILDRCGAQLHGIKKPSIFKHRTSAACLLLKKKAGINAHKVHC